MNHLDKDQLGADVNVISLFQDRRKMILNQEIIENFDLDESFEDELVQEEKKRIFVTENLDPETSLFLLSEQLETLSKTLQKTRFYLDELSEVISIDKN